jgi:hypothetical protein
MTFMIIDDENFNKSSQSAQPAFYLFLEII